MDVSDLKVFEAVARLGAMNRAAAELNTVQSNVTARILKLEEELGTPLFDRHSRGVTLTAAGRRLLPYAGKAARLLEDARRAADDNGTPKGALTIGSLETTAALRLTPILARYGAAHPKVDLVLRTGTTTELVEQVLACRLEGAFVCGPVNHDELEQEAIFEEELVILTAPGVRSLDELPAGSELKTIVLRAGCSYRQRLEDILADRGVVGFRQLEFGTLESIFGCVGAGLGITLLPKSLIGEVWRDGRVRMHSLPARDARARTLFVRRRDVFQSSALAAFVAMAHEHYAAEKPARAEAAE